MVNDMDEVLAKGVADRDYELPVELVRARPSALKKTGFDKTVFIWEAKQVFKTVV